MGRISAILFGVLLGGALVFVAFEYHVVRTKEKFLYVSKRNATLSDAYVDVREWSHQKWHEHPELVHNLTAAGHGSLVARGKAGFFGDLFSPLLEKPGR